MINIRRKGNRQKRKKKYHDGCLFLFSGIILCNQQSKHSQLVLKTHKRNVVKTSKIIYKETKRYLTTSDKFTSRYIKLETVHLIRT